MEARALKDNTAKSTAKFLFEEIITKFGCPLEFISDQGSHFINDTIKVLTQEFMILHWKSTTYYPQANGQAEITNKVIKVALTKMVNANQTNWDTKLHATLWAYRTTYKVTTKHTPFSLVFGTEALLPMAYLHPDVYQKQSQEIHPILEKRMEQLKVMDLTRHEAEENMRHMQTLRKERHDHPKSKTRCHQCKQGTTKPTRNEATSLEKESEQVTTLKPRFYPGQRILWHLRHKIPGPGKFKIRWAGPYVIKQLYDNGSVDVTTLQGDELGRVNMNKLKPYQEPETTQAYALQILACHLLEAKIKAKKSQIQNKDLSQPLLIPSNQGTTSHTKPLPYPDQATLDEEDLEIHRIMLEGYYAQPTKLWEQGVTRPRDHGTKHTQSTNDLVKLQRTNVFTPPKPTLDGEVQRNADHAYKHLTHAKEGGEVHPHE